MAKRQPWKAYVQSIATQAVEAQDFDPTTDKGREAIEDLLSDIEDDVAKARDVLARIAVQPKGHCVQCGLRRIDHADPAIDHAYAGPAHEEEGS